MPTLLKLDVSPRGTASYSRQIGETFRESWITSNPEGTVIERDLAKHQPTYVDLQWIAGAYSAPEQLTDAHKEALKLSDEYIAEIIGADIMLITTPMYNFQMPAVLKARLDHVVRVGKTVNYTENGPVGTLHGKKVVVAIASGGVYTKGSRSENYNFLSPYLRHIFKFIGIDDVTFIEAGGASGIQSGKLTKEEYLSPFLEGARSTARV